ncbi:hypothetical protein [Methanofollis sp. W23]|uniref:hypothetical protein n=1 Tax=Methanofollis sp. W23 TaxID=2817849 RepID=UPI0032AF084F
MIGLRIRPTYEPEALWKRKNRYFGFFLIIIGLLLLLFIATPYYLLFLLSALMISLVAAYVEEKSLLVTPLALFAFFLLTALCACPLLPGEIAVRFSGLEANGWEAKGPYLLAMIALSSLFLLFSAFAVRSRHDEDVLPVMNGSLLFLLALNAIFIAVQMYGEHLIALGYLALIVFLAFVVRESITWIRTAGVKE